MTGSDECAMYFVNFSLDIAIGTFVIWCFVRVQELTARRFDITSLKVGDLGQNYNNHSVDGVSYEVEHALRG